MLNSAEVFLIHYRHTVEEAPSFIQDILCGPLIHSRHPVRPPHSFKTFCEAPSFIQNILWGSLVHSRHSVRPPYPLKTFHEQDPVYTFNSWHSTLGPINYLFNVDNATVLNHSVIMRMVWLACLTDISCRLCLVCTVKTQTVNEFQEFAVKSLKLKTPWPSLSIISSSKFKFFL